MKALASAACCLLLAAPAAAAPHAERTLAVPVPKSGAIEVAIVHFAGAGGFTLSRHSLPRTAALVTATSGRVGVVAIANFHPRRSTAAALGPAKVPIAGTVAFHLDYLGTVANGCGKTGICPAAALDEIERAGRWTAGPGVLPPASAEPRYRTKAGLLAQVIDALIGVPRPEFVLALAGGPQPPATGQMKTPTGQSTSTAAPGLTATASLAAAADGSLTLRVQNTGAVPITSVSLAGIDFTPTALAPAAGVSCRLASPGMVCDAGFSIAPGQAQQFTIASYTCCLIDGQVWVNTQPGANGQYGPILAGVD